MPLVFDKIPNLKIEEVRREYQHQSYDTGNSIITSSDGSITYNYPQQSDYAFITITSGKFSASMEGGTLYVPTPGYTIPNGYELQQDADTTYTAYVAYGPYTAWRMQHIQYM